MLAGAVMGRRKKLGAAGSLPPGTVRLADRTAVAPNRHVTPVVVITEGPDGQRAEHYRATRNDPLAGMEARGFIDHVEYLAGRRWQESWERVEIGGARAIDTTREAVDGGGFPEPFTDAQARALSDLRLAGKAMGVLSESVVHDVLVRGWTMSQIAAARGYSDELSVRFYGRTFREALKTLAVVFGLAMPGRA